MRLEKDWKDHVCVKNSLFTFYTREENFTHLFCKKDNDSCIKSVKFPL